MTVCVCACQFYSRVPRDAVAAVFAACHAAGVTCEVVPDLCGVAARDSAALERLASCRAVLGCQERALRALFGSRVPPPCFDLRATPVEEILAALSLPPAAANDGVPAMAQADAEWVPWFPVIDLNRCTQCRKCVEFCMFGVYAVEGGHVRVTRPAACKTDCPACARICPQNAIIFPKSSEERLNGALAEAVAPAATETLALRERLKHRKIPRLFREDDA